MTNTISRTVLFLAASFVATSSQACSVCIAHAIGAGMRAIGAQVLHHGSTVVGISYSSFSKSQSGEDPGSSEKHTQHELDIDVLHGVNDQWMLRASVPYVFKRLEATGEATSNTQGVGDITLGATYQVPPRPGQQILVALTADVKLPTGNNNLTDSSGTRQDEHTQIGTGSTDLSLGALATMEAKHGGIWFAGLSGRWNGRNRHGYRYGSALFYNVGYSQAIDAASSFVIELNGRIASRDRTEDGSLDENSGGHLGYASFSYRRNLGKDCGLIASYQLPILRRLNGTQSESGLLTFGVSKKL